MATIATVNAKEDFIVQMNGDYNVPFDEMTNPKAGAVVSGEVVTIDTGVYGIAAGAAAQGAKVRVMVRGNPTTVNAQALTGYVSATHKAALEAVGIIVVNE